jgi:D-sedoheptulose 7-phosphate isomerase
MKTSIRIEAISDYLQQVERVLAATVREPLATTAALLYDAWARRAQVFVLGNGGSASTASHIANDLSKATVVPGAARMRVIALTDNVALLTAWANDASYDCVFKEQLENLLNPGDTVLGISASGNSPNVLRAIEFARAGGAVTIAWTGSSGGRLKDIVDHCVHVPTEDVGMIENVHLVFDHLVTGLVAARIRHEAGAAPALRRDATVTVVGAGGA